MADNLRRAVMVAAISFGLLSGCRSANAACEKVPHAVSSYLRTSGGASLVSLPDLSRGDQGLWKKHHDGLCPGLATANLNGQGLSYGLALIKKLPAGIYRERFVVLLRTHRGISVHVVANDRDVTIPFVVWRVPPGKSYDYRVGHDVWLRNDSIVYEEMESVATQYYIEEERFRSLIAAE